MQIPDSPFLIRELLKQRVKPIEAEQLAAQVLLRFTDDPENEKHIEVIARALAMHPSVVARSCADEKPFMFLPKVAEVHEWCRDQTKRLSLALRRMELESEYRSREATQKSDAEIAFDRRNRPSLDELKEQYGPNWGIDPGAKASAERMVADDRLWARERASVERSILAEYAAAGLEPQRSGDVLVSPSLLRSLGKWHPPAKGKLKKAKKEA